MKKINGFTLIELIMVIVILGALSAVAIPKYIDLQSKARKASLDGLAGSLRSAVAVVKVGYYANGKTSPVTMANNDIVVVNTTVGATQGIPTADLAGIVAAIDYSGFIPTVSSPNVIFTIDGGPSANNNCEVLYSPDGLSAVTSSGC